MSTFIKVNGTWVEAVNFWQKVNGTYVQITEADALMYLQTHVFMHDSDTAILSIIMPSVIEAETCQCKAYSNGARVTSGVTWSIISGSDYATIDSSTGLLTVSSQANNNTVIVGMSYDGATVQKSTTVTYKSGGTTETEIIENEDGSYSEINTTVVDNGDGSSTSSSSTTNYDENGNITGSSTNETVNNSDGSSTSTTTNYDENGNPTDATNVSGDVEGNVDTQEIEYDSNGDPVVTAYTIDTSGNPSGSKDITGNGVNTGFYPFDGGDGFEMHIRFRSVKTEQPKPPLVEDTEDKGSNYHFTILCSKDPNSPYPGFHIRWTLSKTNYSSGNLVFGYRGRTGSATNRSLAQSTHDGVYDYTIAYDPTLKKYPSKFRCQDNLNGAATISLNIDFNPLSYGFTLGYNINQQGQPYRYSNVEIYEFSITKL